MKLTGKSIFGSETTGRALHWKKGITIFKDNVIIAKEFTNELALAAISAKAKGIVTCESSFACHAANLLRSARKSFGFSPLWFTDVNDVILTITDGTVLFLGSDGTVSDQSPSRSEELIDSTAGKIRDIDIISLTTGSLSHILWPQRNFDELTFSLMKTGLKINISDLTNRRPELSRLPNGWITFYTRSVTTPVLAKLAGNRLLSLPNTQKIVEVYEQIVKSLRDYDMNKLNSAKAIHRFVDLLTRYFSVFLYYHATYEHVLNKALEIIRRNAGNSEMFRYEDELMTCKLVDWLQKNDIRLINKKDLLNQPEIVSIPPFTIMTDLDESVNRKMEIFNQGLFKHDCDDQEQKYLSYSITVFVIKEWKFLINKLLYSRFAEFAQRVALTMDENNPLSKINNWRSISYLELIKKFENG